MLFQDAHSLKRVQTGTFFCLTKNVFYSGGGGGGCGGIIQFYFFFPKMYAKLCIHDLFSVKLVFFQNLMYVHFQESIIVFSATNEEHRISTKLKKTLFCVLVYIMINLETLASYRTIYHTQIDTTYSYSKFIHIAKPKCYLAYIFKSRRFRFQHILPYYKKHIFICYTYYKKMKKCANYYMSKTCVMILFVDISFV